MLRACCSVRHGDGRRETRPRLLEQVELQRKRSELERGTAQDETVPDRHLVPEAFPAEEEEAQGVYHTAREQQRARRELQALPECPGDDPARPPEEKVRGLGHVFHRALKRGREQVDVQ